MSDSARSPMTPTPCFSRTRSIKMSEASSLAYLHVGSDQDGTNIDEFLAMGGAMPK
jgi:hypothetical protein